MTQITLPASLKPRDFQLDLAVVDRAYGSGFGGQAEQVTDLLNDRWHASFLLPGLMDSEGAVREAFVGSMRGSANWVLLWHMARPLPRGTMRGSPTLYLEAEQGAALLTVQTVAGATLEVGDLIGLDGLLLMCADVCTADGGGILEVPLVNRLRRTVGAAEPIVWNRPTAPFRLVDSSGVQYVPGRIVSDTTLTFIEKL